MNAVPALAHEEAPCFADWELAQAIREALGGALTWTGLAALTALTADARGIYTLTGLAAAVGLRTLSLVDNEIENLTDLAQLVNLEGLHLQGNRCWDLRPLAGLMRLRELTLGGFWVDEEVGALTLEAFGPAWGPAISDLEPLRGLRELRELHVIHHRLKDIGAIAELSRLVKLTLDGYQGGGPVRDWTPLGALRELQELSLCSNRLTEAALELLATLPQLTRADLRGNPLSRRAQEELIPALCARGVQVITGESRG